MTFHRLSTWSIAALLCGLLCGTAHSARAQDRDKAAAEALFDEGRKLMAAGSFAAACPKLEASQALDAGVGTQLNLADCYEKLGKTASAWALFREASAAAHHAGSPERARIARQRSEALEAQLSYLTILAPAEAENLTLTRDGKQIDPAAIGSALPVDPGAYTVAASAPSKRPWSTTVTVGAASRVSVSVPLLEDVEVAREPLQPSAPQLIAANAPAPRDSSPSTQKLIGIVTAGAGVVALAVGGYFGLQAAASWSDAKASCDPYPYCGENGKRLAQDAQHSGTVSTIASIAGGVLLAGGLVLWLSAPGQRQTESALLIGPSSLQLRGSFQ